MGYLHALFFSSLIVIEASPGNAVHEIVFAIPQQGLEQIEKILHEVSDPKSESYGAYLTFEEVGKIVSNPEATAAVKTWLEQSGVDRVSPTVHGEYITAAAPMDKWNELLHADFQQRYS